MTAVNLPDAFLDDVRKYAAMYHRSVPKQIEYWAHIGRTAEENPDLPYEFIRDIFKARASNKFTPYEFDKAPKGKKS